MRRLRVALAACALAAAPAALMAQQTQIRPNPPVMQPHPAHPRPAPSGAHAGHGNHGRNGYPYANGYPVVIDGNVVNGVLATPSPKPKHRPAARTNNGEQVFETHSTDDAR